MRGHCIHKAISIMMSLHYKNCCSNQIIYFQEIAENFAAESFVLNYMLLSDPRFSIFVSMNDCRVLVVRALVLIVGSPDFDSRPSER